VEESLWTVVLTFAAGGRQRQAAWTYDPVLRTVEAGDDEARWLSADEPTSMGPLTTTTPRVTNVYDVEAEGGVAASTRRAAAAARAGHEEEPLDLMTAMRQRTTVGRRSGRRRAASAEPARRETTPALPIETAPPVATVAAATPVPEVHAETPVQPAVDAAVEPPVESPVEPDTHAESLEHLVVADEVEVPEETAAQEPDEPELEPAGAETPPLDEPVDEPVDEVVNRDESLFEADAEPDVEPEVVDDDLVIEADAEPDAEPEVVDDLEADAGLEVIETVEEPAPAPVTKKTASRRKQRPSVPSWDDIMFGAKRD
jgi:hypothetical protein